MDSKTRLIGNTAYIGFFGVAGVALMVYYAWTTTSPWIRFAAASGAVYLSVIVVLAGLVVAHALHRADQGFTLDLQFRRRITLTTLASMTGVTASLFVGAVLAHESVVLEAIVGAFAALLAAALVLGFRDYRRDFPRRRHT